VNIHASLLPKYRGAAPISRAILNGDDASGVTIMVIEEALDAGAILLQKKVPISLSMTAGELSAQLSEEGAQLLIKTLEELQRSELRPIPQDETLVSWAPRFTREMSPISWDRPALEIHNKIRAMNPWPIANAIFRGEKINILRSMPRTCSELSQTLPGTLLKIFGNGISIQCGQGTVLDILEVQRASKGRVSGREFASGARLRAGEVLS